MTQHPITPPEELVASMIEQAFNPLGATGLSDTDQLTGAFADLVTRAAQWGADQELEACCSIALVDPVCGTKHQRRMLVRHIRERRRPKPPSLKEQALEQLDGIAAVFRMTHGGNLVCDTIRRALEQLDG
jgi:hypothetical protein